MAKGYVLGDRVFFLKRGSLCAGARHSNPLEFLFRIRFAMRWIPKHGNRRRAQVLAAVLEDLKLNVPSDALPAVADLLVRRGIDDPEAARRFLMPELSHLHDPLQMSGMKTALERLEAAVERKEKVLIYGDYDVDGTTAIVILKTAIELCGGAADFHVPHRIRE